MKNIRIYMLLLVMIILTTIVISGCKKTSTIDYGQFLGSWISTDLVDTLDFSTSHDLSKNRTAFDYNISGDSITIQYRGPLMIYVFPTTHFYTLKGNVLTIFISKGCYGFRQQETQFIKSTF